MDLSCLKKGPIPIHIGLNPRFCSGVFNVLHHLWHATWCLNLKMMMKYGSNQVPAKSGLTGKSLTNMVIIPNHLFSVLCCLMMEG